MGPYVAGVLPPHLLPEKAFYSKNKARFLTPKKNLMAFEQVVPVVPHGMFSVMTLKVPLPLLLEQKSCTTDNKCKKKNLSHIMVEVFIW